ncbi:MAG: hypothetical protein HDR00_03560 [Lachnospiraceae bacterium]|nr:hypothetical protein [Lachnospiraceae bacterium]
MKKLYALLLAGVMAAALALPTMAAPSPVADSIASGSTVTTTASNVSTAALSQETAEEVVKVTSNREVLNNLNVPTTAHLAAVLEVSYSGTIPAGGVQVPFNVGGLAAKGDTVYILHRQPNAPYTWEVVGQAVLGDDLTVTGTFTSFSPVAFMVQKSTDAAATQVRAPRTGEY